MLIWKAHLFSDILILSRKCFFYPKILFYPSQWNKFLSTHHHRLPTKKLGILQTTFYRSSLFFYDNTIFHLLMASKITPKKYWYYFYIFIGIFSIGNKESAPNGYSFACPFILSDIFPNYTIIYEHIHAIVVHSVYLQFSIHFNLWFRVIKQY